MNKSPLVEALVKDTGLTKKDATSAVASVLDNIAKGLKKDGDVQLIGFGTFKVAKRKARTGRNPATGETMKIAAKKVPVFKAGKELKDLIMGVVAPAKCAKKSSKKK